MSVMISEKGNPIIGWDGYKFYRKSVLKSGEEKWLCIEIVENLRLSTARGEHFLQLNDTINNVIIFTTDSNLKFLSMCSRFYA